jgi:hypothetical protein
VQPLCPIAGGEKLLKLEYVSSNWRPPEPLDVGQFSTEVENIIQLETKRKEVALVVGVVILSLDHAYEDRKPTGLMNSKEDLPNAVTEGTVTRIRPKLMTVDARRVYGVFLTLDLFTEARLDEIRKSTPARRINPGGFQLGPRGSDGRKNGIPLQDPLEAR